MLCVKRFKSWQPFLNEHGLLCFLNKTFPYECSVGGEKIRNIFALFAFVFKVKLTWVIKFPSIFTGLTVEEEVVCIQQTKDSWICHKEYVIFAVPRAMALIES